MQVISGKMPDLLKNGMEWIYGLGESYGVDPVVFALLYLLSIPPYLASIGWTVRNIKNNRSLVFPLLSTAFFFIMPAIYLFVEGGRELPNWIYFILIVLILYGSYSTYRKIKIKISKRKDSGTHGLKI